MSNKASIEAVQEVLGKPIAASLPENALKIRRNLLVCGVAVVLATFGQVTIDPEVSVAGLKFTGITTELIRSGLLAVTVYLLLHFSWYVFEALAEWRLRVTGTRLAFLTGARLGSRDCDYPDDPKQSTLYSWWQQQARTIGNVEAMIDAVGEAHERTQLKLNDLMSSKDREPRQLNGVQMTMMELVKAMTSVKQALDSTRDTIESNRVSVSLARFNSWYSMFLRSQNLRWLLIEVLTPISVGIFSIWLLRYYP